MNFAKLPMEEQNFYEELFTYWKTVNMVPDEFPCLFDHPLDVFNLYQSVISQGGFEKVRDVSFPCDSLYSNFVSCLFFI